MVGEVAWGNLTGGRWELYVKTTASLRHLVVGVIYSFFGQPRWVVPTKRVGGLHFDGNAEADATAFFFDA